MQVSCCGARKNVRAYAFLHFFDRCHSLSSLYPPQAAVASLPLRHLLRKCHLPCKGRLWHGAELPHSRLALPLGELSPQVTERATRIAAAAYHIALPYGKSKPFPAISAKAVPQKRLPFVSKESLFPCRRNSSYSFTSRMDRLMRLRFSSTSSTLTLTMSPTDTTSEGCLMY